MGYLPPAHGVDLTPVLYNGMGRVTTGWEPLGVPA